MRISSSRVRVKSHMPPFSKCYNEIPSIQSLFPHVLKLLLAFTPIHLPLPQLLRAHKLIWPSSCSPQGPQLGKRSRKNFTKTSGYLWHNAKVSCNGRLMGAQRTWPLITVPGEIKGGFREYLTAWVIRVEDPCFQMAIVKQIALHYLRPKICKTLKWTYPRFSYRYILMVIFCIQCWFLYLLIQWGPLLA